MAAMMPESYPTRAGSGDSCSHDCRLGALHAGDQLLVQHYDKAD